MIGDDIWTQAANFSAMIVSANLVALVTSGNVVSTIIIDRFSNIKLSEFRDFIGSFKWTWELFSRI